MAALVEGRHYFVFIKVTNYCSYIQQQQDYN